MRSLRLVLAAAALVAPAVSVGTAHAETCSAADLVCVEGNSLGHTHWCNNWGTTQRQCEVHWHATGWAEAATGPRGEIAITDSANSPSPVTDTCSAPSGRCAMDAEITYWVTFAKGTTQRRCATMTTTGTTLSVVTTAEVEPVRCFTFS